MKQKAIFYHAGCPVCATAEQTFVAALDPARFDVEVVHLAQQRARIEEAQRAGVRSVPALLINGQVFHINHGADLKDLV